MSGRYPIPAICDRCGGKFNRDHLRLETDDKLYVCSPCWDPTEKRRRREFRAPRALTWTRPEEEMDMPDPPYVPPSPYFEED